MKIPESNLSTLHSILNPKFKKFKYEKRKQIDLYRSTNRLQSRKCDKVTLAVFATNDGFLFSFINHMPRQVTKMFAIFKSQSSANGDFANFLVLNNSTEIRFMSQKSMLAIPCNFFWVMSINTKFLCTKYPNFSAQSGSKLLGLPMFMPS